MKRSILLTAICAALQAQSEAPAFDPRLSIHTLVREDIFAGWMVNDLERMARGEKNIELLLAERPQARAELIAWKGGATLARAVIAHEAGRSGDFKRDHERALALFAEASRLKSESIGVLAVIGGSYAVFADRLPEQHRMAAWSDAYRAFSGIYKQQSAQVDKFPLHIKGELLAGLTQSALRTGRTEEYTQNLDRMIASLDGSPYASRAKALKARPETSARASLTCLTCHDAGRLDARQAALKRQ